MKSFFPRLIDWMQKRNKKGPVLISQWTIWVDSDRKKESKTLVVVVLVPL